jgi:hypothetical protein
MSQMSQIDADEIRCERQSANICDICGSKNQGHDAMFCAGAPDGSNHTRR